MPQKKKPLDKKKLDTFKNILVKMREDIINDIKSISNGSGGSGEESSDVSGHVLHMADVATDMYDKEFSLGLASKDRELLQKIDDALVRIHHGTYGLCLGTKKPISEARLKAIPYAEYCLEYQEQLEQEKGR